MVDLYEADVFAGAVKQLGKCLSTYNKLRPADDNVFVRMGSMFCWNKAGGGKKHVILTEA